MSDGDGANQRVITPVHRSLIRHTLPMGCEQGPLVALIAICFIFIVVLQTWLSVAIGIILFIVGRQILQWAAKRDPIMYEVYKRHFKYQTEYHPHPTLARSGVKAKEQQPK